MFGRPAIAAKPGVQYAFLKEQPRRCAFAHLRAEKGVFVWQRYGCLARPS